MINYKHSKLTAMGAGEAGDMDLDQGCTGLLGRLSAKAHQGPTPQ